MSASSGWRPYTASAARAAEKTNQAAELLEEIDSLIDDVFKNDRRLEALFAGAAVGRNARREAIDKAFKGRSTPSSGISCSC